MSAEEYEKNDPRLLPDWLAKSDPEKNQAMRKFYDGHPDVAPLNYGTFPDPGRVSRRWMVVSTIMVPGWLLLWCENTGAEGAVKAPTADEWSAAFHAPSNPYLFADSERVTLMREGGEAWV